MRTNLHMQLVVLRIFLNVPRGVGMGEIIESSGFSAHSTTQMTLPAPQPLQATQLIFHTIFETCPNPASSRRHPCLTNSTLSLHHLYPCLQHSLKLHSNCGFRNGFLIYFMSFLVSQSANSFLKNRVEMFRVHPLLFSKHSL